MKYKHTPKIYIKEHPTTGMFYFKRGSIEESLRTTDWKEAELRASVKLDEIQFAGVAAFKRTVKDLYGTYLHARAQDEHLSEGSFREIKYVLEKHLLPHFGKNKLYKVTPVAWANYCSGKKKLDLANHRKVLRGFLKWCVDKGYLAGVPDVTRIPKHRRRQRRIVKNNEILAIFEHAQGSLRLFLALALYNGLRRKEIMTLEWSGIDLDVKFLTVKEKNNKLRRGRRLPISDNIVRLLRERQVEQKRGRWVFPHAHDPKNHADLGGLKTAWRTCLRKAKLEDITWHDLRATYEKHAHMSLEHTDTQKEKFADSSTAVQKRIYVSMDHEDLRGLENVVSIPGLDMLLFRAGISRGSET